VRYIKEAFDVTTFAQAKNVVLSDDPNDPKKFDRETDFLVDTIKDNITITDESVVLDFGCGMGRVSKKLIDTFNCNVIGVDISDSMLTFARLYTANVKKFIASKECPQPESVDVCLAVLVLQHTENPKQEIDKICNALKPGGYLVLVNEAGRLIPGGVENGFIKWATDHFDVFGEINSRLTRVNSVRYINHDTMSVVFYKKI
jgi:SAM-dependent methyltransferase